MKKIGLLLSIILIVSGCVAKTDSQTNKKDNNSPINEINENTPFYNDVNIKEAKEIMENNANLMIIDVSSEYTSGHIKGSVNIPFSEFENKVDVLDKKKSYLIFGRIKSYSQAAASRLAEKGFEDVYRLDANFEDLEKEGVEIEK